MISKADVTKIASLSKLSLDEAAKERFATELSNILGFVDKMNQLKLDGIEPTSHAVEVTNVFRPDEVVVSPARAQAIESSPAHDGTLFQVPRVI